MNDTKPELGRTYGRITIVAPAGRLRGYVSYLCKCVCGTEKVIAGSLVVSGRVRSCGCLAVQHRTEWRAKRRASIAQAIARRGKVDRVVLMKNRLSMLGEVFSRMKGAL